MASNLEAVGVCKHYGATRALHDVNIQVVAGEFLTLLGPSGSGKRAAGLAVHRQVGGRGKRSIEADLARAKPSARTVPWVLPALSSHAGGTAAPTCW
jgi:ABC-type nitrate/sulfonate/bicarbonate transport system ATPase subunit